MKKLIALLLVFTAVLCLCACKPDNQADDDEDQVSATGTKPSGTLPPETDSKETDPTQTEPTQPSQSDDELAKISDFLGPEGGNWNLPDATNEGSISTAALEIYDVKKMGDKRRVFYYRTPEVKMAVTLIPLSDGGYGVNMPTLVDEADAEVTEIQELLHGEFRNLYNVALFSDYATGADVDLFYLFYSGFDGESQTATDAESAYLDGKLHEYWVYGDLIRLPTEKMDAVLMEYFGITLDQTNGVGLDKLVYWEETDCYYHTITGANYAEITVEHVEHQDDGSIRVYYYRQYPRAEMVLTLMPKDEGYQILSNMPAEI